MLTKSQYVKRFMIWTAILTMCVVGGIGLAFGTVIEATLFEEVAKWVVMGLGITGIMEVFAFTLGPLSYHWIYEKIKNKKSE